MNNSNLIFLIVLFLSCKQSNNAPDVSEIIIEPTFVRFEKKLFEGDTSMISARIDELMETDPEFTDVYLKQIIADPTYGNDPKRSAEAFVKDSFIQALYDTSQQLYGNFEEQSQELTQALKYFKHYFPDKPLPKVYTCISGFDVGSFTIGDDIMGIGLDFYLGDTYSNYHPDLFPAYIKSTMTPDFLVPKSIQALIGNYLGETNGNKLIDHMIRNGIELYIKAKLLPTYRDELVYEYTGEQIEWLEQNESQIWGHLIQEDLLYSTNYRSYQKLVTPSPNVPNMPEQAPGRLGNWIGARIVSSYMDRHPNTSLEELLVLKEAQKILAESKYKPRQ